MIDFIPADEFSDLEFSDEELTLVRDLTSHRPTTAKRRSDPMALELLARSLPPLTPDEERALFRRMNYVKFRAEAIRSTLENASPRQANRKQAEISKLLAEAEDVRRRIVDSNLRLVATVCRKYAHSEQEFHEFVSEGLMILLKALAKFDYSRGFRFSTYAFNSIQRHLYRVMKRNAVSHQRFTLTPDDVLAGTIEAAETHDQPEVAPEEMYRRLMHAANGCLTEREELVVRRRFGIDGSGVSEPLRQIAADLRISKERVRQIQLAALAKLRTVAEECNLAATLA
jgi:RNA polymerase sigma factor (sigma-70 family)